MTGGNVSDPAGVRTFGPAGRVRRRPRTVLRFFFSTAAGLFILAAFLLAGPPFFTDDPEPVDFRHWEFYLASAQIKNGHDDSGTAPHFEINYGIAPNAMLHIIAAAGYDRPKGGPFRYGLGDTEIGLKFRFVAETEGRPQIGTFPQIEVPTGASGRGLGSGRVQVFLPLWIQKSWGPWTSYGGGGYRINPGPGNSNYWWFGWEAQREISKAVTLGAELFTNTRTAAGGSAATGFNLGAIVSLGGISSALVSIGRDIHGPDSLFLYVAYYLTFGLGSAPRPRPLSRLGI